MKLFYPIFLASIVVATSANECAQLIDATTKGIIFYSRARADCSTFLALYPSTSTVIVTPLASTTTTVIQVQATTSSTVTKIITKSTTGTVFSTSTATVDGIFIVSSTTVEGYTVTSLATTTPTITSTSIVTVTNTAVASTSTLYYPTYGATVKRDIEVRATSAVCDSIPTYTTACTNYGDYASACGLAGVSTTTATVYSTLPISTVTVSSFSTMTHTSTIVSDIETELPFTDYQTIIATATQTIHITLPATTTSSTTFYSTITASPSTTYVYSTTTTSVSSIETVSVPIPNFIIAMTPVAGGTTLYIQKKSTDAQSIIGVTSSSSATVYTINTSNQLIDITTNYVTCAYTPLANYYFEGVSAGLVARYPTYFTPIPFVIGSDKSLTFTYSTATAFSLYADQFWYSTPLYSGFPTYTASIIPQS
ncbi:hypothetical protein BP5796_12560 [Coleophoma crateriformis]|uniref:CBM1 domain-containing protein n=1 Tax=Coleophoma crateriformis TaxID=565419 RepID=A0A3D8Q7I1_9HELO|nr:hypothetical protein BP5796_12560 [Coleophoma crateriformis]